MFDGSCVSVCVKVCVCGMIICTDVYLSIFSYICISIYVVCVQAYICMLSGVWERGTCDSCVCSAPIQAG